MTLRRFALSLAPSPHDPRLPLDRRMPLLYRVSVRLCRFAHPGPDPVWQVVSIRRVDSERAPIGQELN